MSTLFDPRQAPRVPAPPHAGPVPPSRLHPDALRQRFSQPPAWAPEAQLERWLSGVPAVAASVLLPLVVRPGAQGSLQAATVLLTQRHAALRNHGGQISFPGGRRDPQDADDVATALREVHEEVGLAPSRIEVIGTLPRYETGTGFIITPVVGLVYAGPQEEAQLALEPDPAEVESAFEVPLAFLLDPGNHERRALNLGERELSFFAMPWSPPSAQAEHFIWGATAAMLRNFYRFMVA